MRRRTPWIVLALALVAAHARAQEESAPPAAITVRVESTPSRATVEVLGRGAHVRAELAGPFLSRRERLRFQRELKALETRIAVRQQIAEEGES